MKNKRTIIFRRFLAFICVLVLGTHVILPAMAASEANATSETKVITGNNFSTYFCQNADYSSVIYLNTVTGEGSFAVIYADSPTNLYDLTFSANPNQMLTDDFWESLSDDCFVRVRSVEPIYIPHAISVQPAELTQRAAGSTTADINYFRNELIDIYGSEHTNKLLRTSMVNGVLFEQKETLEFGIGKSSSYIVRQAISVAGLAVSLASFFIAPNLLSVLGVLASGAGMFPAGTELTEYAITVFCERYVTTAGGNVIRSYTYRYITHYGHSSTNSSNRMLSVPLLPTYSPSESFFNSATQQFNAAYQDYINP